MGAPSPVPPAGLSLPLRLEWVLAHEDGRPAPDLGGPGPLLLGAGVLSLLHAGALAEADGSYVAGDGEPADGFLAWTREHLLLEAGRPRDAQLEALAARGAGRAQRRAGAALEAAGVLVRRPRRVLGVPFGTTLRVADVDALRAERGRVREVLEGAVTTDAALAALVAYLHHGGLVGHLAPRDLHAAETRARRLAGEHREGDPERPIGPVADAVRATVDAMHVVLVPVGAVQVVTTEHVHHAS